MSTIRVETGDPFEISLQSSGGTGYVWTLRQMSSNVSLTGTEETVIFPSRIITGGPVRWVFHFIAMAPGPGEAIFELIRPWEPWKPADRKVFKIEVSADSQSADDGADDLEAEIGAGKFQKATSAMVHIPPTMFYGVNTMQTDDDGHPVVVGLYGFPGSSDAGNPILPYGTPGPAVMHATDPEKCVVKYGTPWGMATDPKDCCMLYGFPVDPEQAELVFAKYGFPIHTKYGFPIGMREAPENCVAKYGTPSGIAVDPKDCVLKYGFPVFSCDDDKGGKKKKKKKK